MQGLISFETKDDLFWLDLIQSIDVSDPGEAGFSGSLIVAQFDGLQEARDWADADPYVSAGVYSSVIVKPFNKVLP